MRDSSLGKLLSVVILLKSLKNAENLGKSQCSNPKSLSSRLETVKIHKFTWESVMLESAMFCHTMRQMASLSDGISV